MEVQEVRKGNADMSHVLLTEEQAQQIDEIIEHLLVSHPTARHHKACVEALSIIRAARAQERQPKKWIDLTDDEIKAAYESWYESNGNHAFPIWVGAKAVIAADREKNNVKT